MAGLSQRTVAKLLNVSNTNCISRWEKGLTTPPLTIVLQLSIIYNTSPIHLYLELWESLKQDISLDLDFQENLFSSTP